MKARVKLTKKEANQAILTIQLQDGKEYTAKGFTVVGIIYNLSKSLKLKGKLYIDFCKQEYVYNYKGYELPLSKYEIEVKEFDLVSLAEKIKSLFNDIINFINEVDEKLSEEVEFSIDIPVEDEEE
jgi:RNAse (barnase) inhibitor barstar